MVHIQVPSGTEGVDSRILDVDERGVPESGVMKEGLPGIVVVDLR